MNGSFKRIVDLNTRDLDLDLIAISEILNNRFILGDRTNIAGISRRPWLSQLNSDTGNWDHYNLKDHDEKYSGSIPEIFFKHLCDEIKFYVGKKKEVGILLSGGMDSRIVAGCLDYLMKNKF